MALSKQEQIKSLKSLLDVPEIQRAPMSKDLSELFIRCSLADLNKFKLFNTFDIDEKQYLLRILQDRLNKYKIEVSLPTGLFVGSLCDRPALAVMWAFTLGRLYKEHKKPIMMAELSTAFPWGFPVGDAYGELWKLQKHYVEGIGVNLLDQSETWA